MHRALGIVAACFTAFAGAAIPFVAAGRFDLPWLWAYGLLWAVFVVGGAVAADPALVRERMRPGPGAKDSLSVAALFSAVVWGSHLVLAGLDVGRLHWSDSVPTAARVLGFAGLVGSFGMMSWATRANPFFSSVVRIQEERGHRVVSAGPYRFVRHPGYAGGILMFVASGLALGSWLSLLPSIVAAAALVARTLFEEGVLRRELPGYEEYLGRVRYRLVPGLW
jgi:protein-S-isoprenylcysteine O-methyltransferase Ste14